MSEIFTKLAAPFPATEVHWRVGATNKDKTNGIALAYLDARNVMERLDEVVGPAGWQCRYPFSGCCELSVKIGNEWIIKTNCADETDVEGVKGQASTAFKRAAVLFGIGRYLYMMRNAWFPIESYGRSHRFTKEAEAQMTDALHKWQSRNFGEAA